MYINYTSMKPSKNLTFNFSTNMHYFDNKKIVYLKKKKASIFGIPPVGHSLTPNCIRITLDINIDIVC